MTGHKRDRVMSNEINSEIDPGQPMVYQIRIEGHLGREWADWFEGLTITALDNGETLLTGPVVDQAALHGLLRKVRDLGIPLLLVVRVSPDPADALDVKQEMNDRIKANLEETHESTTWGSDRAT
jgi:hypothetical protein